MYEQTPPYSFGVRGRWKWGPGHLHGKVDDPLYSHERAQLRHLPAAATCGVGPLTRPLDPDVPPPLPCACAPRRQPVNRGGARLRPDKGPIGGPEEREVWQEDSDQWRTDSGERGGS